MRFVNNIHVQQEDLLSSRSLNLIGVYVSYNSLKSNPSFSVRFLS